MSRAPVLRRSLDRLDPAFMIGLVTGLAALVVMSWRLGRPAFWVDESASVLATQRPWREILSLLPGADAPLVPYYFLLKFLTDVGSQLVPGLNAHPEVMYRWPSAVAAALSVGLLSAWLARRASPRLGLAVGAVLLLMAGLSRYGQEARPYAFTVLAAVASTVLWGRLMDDADRRRGLFYALSVVALVCTHLLCVTVVIAHLVAAAWTAPSGRRLSDVRGTVLFAALGVLLVSPFAFLAATHAHGPSSVKPLTPALIWSTLSDLFTVSGPAMPGIGVLFVLALLGLSRARWGDDTRIARTAVAWALVPLMVLLPFALLRPGLLRVRYVVFTIPGWAILAGLGVLTLAELARRVSARLGAEPRAGRVAGLVAGSLVLALATWTQVPSLLEVRSPAGHGEDVRPVLAYTSTGSNAKLPIVTSGKTATIVFAAYRRHEEDRLVGTQVQRDRGTIWPLIEPDSRIAAELRHAPRVLFLQRSNLDPCPRQKRERASAFVHRCLPQSLSRMGYRVLSTKAPGRNWVVALLGR
jgi:mannosyltransferase